MYPGCTIGMKVVLEAMGELCRGDIWVENGRAIQGK